MYEFRYQGLVDSDSAAEFHSLLENDKLTWPGHFCKWMESGKGRLRSLVKTMEVCMLKSVRTSAGLGLPPNKWVNNVTESLPHVMKEQLHHNSVDLVSFLEKMKTKLFDQQMEELIRGIHGMGEYRLIDSMARHAVNPVQWTAMTADQRKSHVTKVLGLKNDHLQHSSGSMTRSTLSIPVNQTRLVNKLPLGTLKELWGTAEFLKEQSKVLQLIGGNFCVADVDRAYTVEEYKVGELLYKCECTKFKALDGMCSHVLVVADKNDCLAILLDRYSAFGGNINKIMANCAPKRAGEKCHNKKPRKGKNNVTSLPIVQSHTPMQELHDKEIDEEKEMEFKEYWHNNENFYVHIISDADCKRAKRCESCSIEFPRRNPKVGCDLVIVHKERYMRPDVSGDGKRRQVLTSHLGRKFYSKLATFMMNEITFCITPWYA